MRLSRRGWNNVMIIAVICFIAVVQLPEIVKQRFGHQDSSPELSAEATLLPFESTIEQLHLPHTSLNREDTGWLARPRVGLPAEQLISHWQLLSGTAVSHEVVGKLKPTLPLPISVEIWLVDQEEPVRVTVYQQPQFWLLQNWQGEWLAVSVEEAYLFPPVL
ncbi:hypothetical protein [Photobacterium lutimaris]|uniref:Uncharacterized protein n=1 Tax=Photobacterium lutimaris TaxID=388278 RepID=A0A2T3IWV7_9GAMM|nr:hypothetical protein [Photobacterium lutimaris]PSU32970.1 hypothetical protein C9I99_15300 [Photobacterium lutimaris]TDR74044.1 hypothetical protein DFP78_109103 [Photobacterium lutimaris]